MADGTCTSSQQSCTGGGTLTLATCGGDTCGCSAPCAGGGDCKSGCCTTAGFCAPACVCDGTGDLYLNCKMQGAGFPGMKRGCDATPGDAGAATGLWLLLALAGLALLRQKLPLT